MTRDNRGRFSKTVSTIKKIVIIGIIVSIAYVSYKPVKAFIHNAQFVQTYNPGAVTATTTAPTRLQQVQNTINELTSQREQDPSFIAETARMQQELIVNRQTQARLDALFIVKTQLDEEITGLEGTSTKK